MKNISTTDTVIMGTGPRKYYGWCKEVGIDHHWQSGPTLTCNPPIQTRNCLNCGMVQHLRQEWYEPE